MRDKALIVAAVEVRGAASGRVRLQVGHQHLQAYLNEFTFRCNRRRTPMAAFQTLLGFGAQLAPTTYRQLYAVESTG